MDRRQFVAQVGLAAAASAIFPRSAIAQSIEQVKILYGFPAGSAGDIIARRVGDKFSGTPYTKNGAIVDNRPGAGGRIALEALKAAPTDGSVIAHTPWSAISMYPHVYKKMNDDGFVDFQPLSTSTIIYHGISVGPMVPASVKTLRDFIAWAKANPEKANYGSPAAGSTPHFIGALMAIQSGVDFKHVAYRGSIPGITDAVGGQIACMICPHGDHLENHKAGKLRLLATSGSKRSPFAPDVPTFAEQGFRDLTVEEWFGFYGPANMPAPVAAAASAAINAALKDSAVQTAANAVGLIVQGSTPEEQLKSARAEFEKWGPLVKRIGFTADS